MGSSLASHSSQSGRRSEAASAIISLKFEKAPTCENSYVNFCAVGVLRELLMCCILQQNFVRIDENLNIS